MAQVKETGGRAGAARWTCYGLCISHCLVEGELRFIGYSLIKIRNHHQNSVRVDMRCKSKRISLDMLLKVRRHSLLIKR